MNELAKAEASISPSGPRRGIGYVVSAAAVFMATIYAPFAIAVLLFDAYSHGGSSGFGTERLDYLIEKVLVCMITGTALNAWRTRTPFIVAPAVGFTVFFISGMKVIPSSALYWCGIAAGALVFFVSQRYGLKQSLRFYILEALPDAVKAGVRGGVGALLAESAVEGVVNQPKSAVRIVLVVAGGVILVSSEFISAYLRSRNLSRANMWSGILRLAYFLVPLSIFLLSCAAFGVNAAKVQRFSPPDFAVSIIADAGSLFLMPTRNELLAIVSFSMVLLFVFLTDIPGTPYELLATVNSRGRLYRRSDEHAQRAINASFSVDAFMAVFNSFLLVPPSIYYSENFVLKNDEDETHLRSGISGYICSLFLLTVALLNPFTPLPIKDISDYLRLAVSPVLLFIGIRIVATSMVSERELDEGGGYKAATRNVLSLSYFPTAAIIILTPIIGLQLSLPCGIILYCAIQAMIGIDEGMAEAGGDEVQEFLRSKAGRLVVTIALFIISAMILIFSVPITVPRDTIS